MTSTELVLCETLYFNLRLFSVVCLGGLTNPGGGFTFTF